MKKSLSDKVAIASMVGALGGTAVGIDQWGDAQHYNKQATQANQLVEAECHFSIQDDYQPHCSPGAQPMVNRLLAQSYTARLAENNASRNADIAGGVVAVSLLANAVANRRRRREKDEGQSLA